MREVERYIAGRLEPAELCHGGPASDVTRKVAVVLASDYAALEAENARLERSVSHWQGLAVTNRKVADDALARLAEVRGREAVGKVVAISGFRQAAVLLDAYQTASAGQSLVGSKLYALPPASPDVEGLVKALTKTVASLDQLLPYLGKIPADVGLLNDALVAARPLLELNTNKEVTPDGK